MKNENQDNNQQLKQLKTGNTTKVVWKKPEVVSLNVRNTAAAADGPYDDLDYLEGDITVS
jgi:hypothetical protein